MIGKIVQFYKPYSKYENNDNLIRLTGIIKDKFLGLTEASNEGVLNYGSHNKTSLKTHIAIDHYLIVSGKYTYSIPCNNVTPVIILNAEEARKRIDSNNSVSLEDILYKINEIIFIDKSKCYHIVYEACKVSPLVVEELQKLGYNIRFYNCNMVEISWEDLKSEENINI